MASQPPDPPFSAGAGGGGKIATNKRRWRFNPYNPPPPPPPPAPPTQQSPTWLSGAGKIFSSIFVSDSSSPEASSTDEQSFSEDDVDCDDSDGGNQDRTNGSNLEAEILPQGCTSKELGAGMEQSGRKHVIMQLLLQETFSREECDELVKIINSRVPEHSSVDRGEVVDSALISGSGVLNVSADHAIMEARKFLEEKKVGRSPQSDVGGLHSAMVKHIESGVGSPADMAKSYMQARPPWASRSIDRFDLTTPSTLIRQVTSEEKLHSVSPLKARNGFAIGAWSMQDEIRRLRSKATEDMLSPLSRSRHINGKTVAVHGDEVNALSMFVETKTEDQLAKLATGADSN